MIPDLDLIRPSISDIAPTKCPPPTELNIFAKDIITNQALFWEVIFVFSFYFWNKIIREPVNFSCSIFLSSWSWASLFIGMLFSLLIWKLNIAILWLGWWKDFSCLSYIRHEKFYFICYIVLYWNLKNVSVIFFSSLPWIYFCCVYYLVLSRNLLGISMLRPNVDLILSSPYTC